MRWEPTIRSTHPEEDDDPSSYVLSGGGGGEAYSAGNGGAGGAAGVVPAAGAPEAWITVPRNRTPPGPCRNSKHGASDAIREYLDSSDPDEVVRLRPRAEMPTVSHPEAAERAISLGCDEGPRERELVSRLLACLHPDPLTDGETEAGFRDGSGCDRGVDHRHTRCQGEEIILFFVFVGRAGRSSACVRTTPPRRARGTGGTPFFFFFASFVWSLSLRNRSGRGGAGGRTQIVRGSRVERGRKSRDEKEKDGEGG